MTEDDRATETPTAPAPEQLADRYRCDVCRCSWDAWEVILGHTAALCPNCRGTLEAAA